MAMFRTWMVLGLSLAMSLATVSVADDDKDDNDDKPKDPIVEAQGCGAKCKAVFIELVAWKKPKCDDDCKPKVECAPCKQKICVPEPSKTKVPRVYFEKKDVDYCLPKCPCPFAWVCKLCPFKKCGKGDECGDCKECKGCGCETCANCLKPRKKHALIKKVVNEEVDGFKCVVKEVEPTCVTPCEVDDKCVILEAPVKGEPTFKPLEPAPTKAKDAAKPVVVPAK